MRGQYHLGDHVGEALAGSGGHDEVAVQELAGGGALLGSLHQTPRHEVDKLGAPSVGRKLDYEILYDLRSYLSQSLKVGGGLVGIMKMALMGWMSP